MKNTTSDYWNQEGGVYDYLARNSWIGEPVPEKKDRVQLCNILDSEERL